MIYSLHEWISHYSSRTYVLYGSTYWTFLDFYIKRRHSADVPNRSTKRMKSRRRIRCWENTTSNSSCSIYSFDIILSVFSVIVSILLENWNYDTSSVSSVSYNWSIDDENISKNKLLSHFRSKKRLKRQRRLMLRKILLFFEIEILREKNWICESYQY